MAATESKEELIRDNERQFIEASGISAKGPLKYMSKVDIDKVHEEIDVRMQELEDTGLSRNEILLDDPVSGVKLYDDPFFQLLKAISQKFIKIMKNTVLLFCVFIFEEIRLS